MINKQHFSKKEHFFEGRLLNISGYSHSKNNYDWDIEHENPQFTHGTSIIRQTYTGIFRDNGELGYIELIDDKDVTNNDANGMSGGIVYDIQNKGNKTKFSGLILTVSNNMSNFLPSYLLMPSILNYKNAPCEILDPIENEEPSEEKTLRALEVFKEYLTSYQNKKG